MRPCAVWAAVIALLIPLAGQAADSAKPSEHGMEQYSGAPVAKAYTKSLVDDEFYRRDGVIKEMPTCLLVAADEDALGLWDQKHMWHTMDVPVLWKALYELTPSEKGARGFGTIWACAQILRSWYTRLSTRSQSRPTDSVDGRVEHGAVVIDLGFRRKGDQSDHPDVDRDGRVTIDPMPLVRLLSSPQLLPSWAFGGIVVRRATINGTLLLHNLHLSIPLAFVNVRFIGSDYRKDVYAIDKPIEDTAISIIHSRFTDYIVVSKSQICGSVRINDSYFGENIEWRGIVQKPLEMAASKTDQLQCSDDRTQEKRLGFYINGSEFAQGLRINKSDLGFFYAFGNSISRFDSSSTNFGSKLDFGDNDFGSIVISGSSAKENFINYNRIKNDFFIKGSANSDRKIEAININSNRVGGGIGFVNFPSKILPYELNSLPDELSFPPFDLGLLPEELSFESNHVGNGSLLCLPKEWRGTVSLDGSSYDGKLVIGLTDTKGQDDGNSLRCSAGFPFPKHFDQDEDTYCPNLRSGANARADGVVRVNLEAADIRTLGWHLPLDCGYRWKGFGLKYRLWQPHDAAAGTLSGKNNDGDLSPLRVFRAWRTTLWSHEPAPLDAMSHYLTDNGAYVQSREIMLEAKRLNYAPSCPPDSYTVACPFWVNWNFVPDGISPISTPPADAEVVEITASGGAEDVQQQSMMAWSQNLFWSLWDHILSVLMLFFLWPGGYGAAPERAVVLIGGFAVIFYVIYMRYSMMLKGKLDAVPRYIQHMSGIKTCTLAKAPEKPLPRQGLKEVHRQGFAYSSPDPDAPSPVVRSAETERLPWPTEDEWKPLGTDERLAVIQDLLLPALKKHIAESEQVNYQQDLRMLRQRLGHFGNTETLGFSLFDSNKMPTRFTHWLYSIDTMLPFIDLHAYGNYYPESGWIRTCSIIQHVLGWWLLTVFIASAAIL